MSMSPMSRGLTAAAGLALTVTLSACSAVDSTSHGSMTGGGAATSASAADHNDADVMFSTMMIPHHEQALEMAELVPSRTDDAEVRDLADRIRAGQQPEIDEMSGWLRDWGAPRMSDAGGHGGHAGMDGMMSEDDLRELEGLSGPEFDRRWLEMMVEHHEGAVVMAEDVLRSGRHDGTRRLAEAVVEAQQAEIREMQAILGG